MHHSFALLLHYYACIIPLNNVLFLSNVFSIFESEIVPFRARKISILGSRLAGMYHAYFTIISNVSLTHTPDQPTTPRASHLNVFLFLKGRSMMSFYCEFRNLGQSLFVAISEMERARIVQHRVPSYSRD
jgi:hypothetical protein